jgi:Holliday junction resolvase-like predicted endonuclease
MTNTDRPVRAEVNCTTGEVNLVPLTDEEIAFAEQRAADNIARQAAEEAAAAALATLKASAKAKLVAGTPLTEEEAATIVL